MALLKMERIKQGFRMKRKDRKELKKLASEGIPLYENVDEWMALGIR